MANVSPLHPNVYNSPVMNVNFVIEAQICDFVTIGSPNNKCINMVEPLVNSSPKGKPIGRENCASAWSAKATLTFFSE